ASEISAKSAALDACLASRRPSTITFASTTRRSRATSSAAARRSATPRCRHTTTRTAPRSRPSSRASAWSIASRAALCSVAHSSPTLVIGQALHHGVQIRRAPIVLVDAFLDLALDHVRRLRLHVRQQRQRRPRLELLLERRRRDRDLIELHRLLQEDRPRLAV